MEVARLRARGYGHGSGRGRETENQQTDRREHHEQPGANSRRRETTGSGGTAAQGASTGDPRVRYDRRAGRWYILMFNIAVPNRYLLAVSSTSTITSSSRCMGAIVPHRGAR